MAQRRVNKTAVMKAPTMVEMMDLTMDPRRAAMKAALKDLRTAQKMAEKLRRDSHLAYWKD